MKSFKAFKSSKAFRNYLDKHRRTHRMAWRDMNKSRGGLINE